MARQQRFLSAEFSDQFKEPYAKLQHDQQKAVDKTVVALLKQEVTAGTRVKPIEPDKYHLEARISDGDRLIHRVEDGRVKFVDVVDHDDIGRYSKSPKQSGPQKRR